MNIARLAWAFGALFALSAQAAEDAIEIHPGPIAGEAMVLDSARGAPWCEIVPVTGTPPALTMQIYNSSSVDVCPREHSAHLDPVKLARQMGVAKVVLNHGRYWVMDRVSIFTAGETLEIEGVKVKWAATMTPEDVATILGGQPYDVVTIKRDTEWLYRAGKPVWVLRAPDGKVWVMQTFGKDKDPSLSLDTLDGLAGKLNLPQGWRFEEVVLEQDLSLQPRRAMGIAYILRDDLGNAYQGCGFDATCNFVP